MEAVQQQLIAIFREIVQGDEKANGGIPKTKAEEYRQAFAFFDSNNDGFITAEELEQAMQRCGRRPSRLELKLIMFHGDKDSNPIAFQCIREGIRFHWEKPGKAPNEENGCLTFDEFVNLMMGRQEMGKYTYAQLKEQFNMFDRDQDGYIEKNEMLKCVNELALTTSFPKPVVEQLFLEADTDGDGRISFEEFVLAVN